jgi:hypothetical protein
MTAREEVDGPPQVYRSASLQHAIDFACRLKDEGRYDWFRGQVRHEPPHSSLFRRFTRDPAAHQLAVRRAEWFKEWVRITPELAYLLDGEDLYALHAIAQHYGIPTNLLDFTTDPRIAGFFAADTAQVVQTCESCIYCLDTRSLEMAWLHARATRERSTVRIEPIRIAVDNLWRLQAQRGVFLHANYNWDADYPMDRILFPYSGYPDAPSSSEVYPVDKSSLEILLDQYFDRERQIHLAYEVQRFVSTDAPGSTVHLLSAGPASAAAEPRDDVRSPTSSWSKGALDGWHANAVEDYEETVVNEVRLLCLDPTAAPTAWSDSIGGELGRMLSHEQDLRLRTVAWQIRGLQSPTLLRQCEEGLRVMWNGMRRLPYTDEEIAACAASVVLLAASGFSNGSWDAARERVFTECFEEPVLVGLACADGSGAHAFVGRAALLNGLRSIDGASDHPRLDLEQLFRQVADPTEMFEFPFLREQFVRHIIPCQVALGRSPVLFNPAKVTFFGNP